jgi:hypothetical protein
VEFIEERDGEKGVSGSGYTRNGNKDKTRVAKRYAGKVYLLVNAKIVSVGGMISSSAEGITKTDSTTVTETAIAEYSDLVSK